MDATPSRHNESPHTPLGPGLSFDGPVRVDGRLLFARLTFRAQPGRWTALLGRSGAGKTTLLRALAGLLSPADAPHPPAADDGAAISGRVAWMAQSDLLPPWSSALDAVLLGARLRDEPIDAARRAAAERLLADMGLAGRAHARPAELSGGERQRVALARTLFEDRPIVLLDEPFSALDAATRAELHELAWSRLAGRTVILVTHDPLEATRLAHDAWILRPGGALERAALPGHPLRDPADPDALATAATLTARLRAAP